jgi:hypothetical protein
MLILLLGFTCLTIMGSCSGGKSESKGNTGTMEESEIAADSVYLPKPSDTFFYSLVANTDYIDIIFHSLPISISMDQPVDIRRFFTFFNASDVKISAECQPNATITFLQDGEILAESYLYFSTVCRVLSFNENQLPQTAVPLNLEGVRYFSNIITQSRLMFEKNQQQQQQ